ncbi:MAG TPA: hypothetical protein VMT34_12110 [Aggregatilineales bacterium]|nr:hypothetical protein [Aggregatilineales bacterium]
MARRLAILLPLMHVLRTTVYRVVAPIFEVPDENYHFPFVLYAAFKLP